MDIDGDGVVNAADCSPTNAAINPGATELCNGVDDDCDGLTDDAYDAPGCTVYFGDKDGDGFGVGGGVCLCGPSGVLSALKAGDCDPQNEKIHPGASEFCNGVDDNCDGITDVGAVDCSNWYTDSDGDGFGSGAATCACEAPSNVVSNSGDCNDASAAISPKAVESCDGIDNNCDGATDEAGAKGCTNFHADADGDGYGDPAKVACLCAASGVFTVINSQDCDDTQAAAFFGAVEACDGVDNNCDGVTDEAGATGCVTYFKDGDGDGFGGGFGLCLCQANATYAFTDNSDCNDANAGIHPGAAESCGVIDHDCNGLVNEPGAGGCLAYARDHDGDGYGLAGDTTCLCVPAGEYTTTDTSDCDDNAKAVHPMAAEICNGVDDNCDGVTDPTGAGGCYTVYTDGDADGFGGNVTGVCLCTYGAGYSSVHTDCNDADASVHPGVTESCNGKDDNCDGVTDPANSANCVSYYEDDDTDGYGQSGKKQCTCLSGAPFTATVAGDCNDAASAINPGANEVCNGVDDNCNGQIDEGLLKTWYIDADQDGYGTGVGAASCTGDSSHTVTVGGDCDDTSNAIHPLALEVCNFVDDDCNGQTDDGLAATLWYVDNDNDGYGGASSASLCKANATYKVATSGDCNDTNSAIHPGATDICDGIDNNCSGQADEGLATFSYYHDGDGDTYGAGAASFQCGPYGTHTVLSNSDCNDANSAVHPGATEICGDGIDNNCNAQVDEGCAVCTASTLQDFESGVGTGWALSTYWYVATWLPVTGTYALTFGDPSLCGYPVETNYATSANFTIPTGAKYLKLSLRLVNYYACSSYDISYNCIGTHTIDSTAKIVLKLGTTTQTFGPYGYYNGGTQTVTWAIDPSQWGTTVNLSAAFTSAWGSTDCLGGAAIDDVRITCN